METRTHFIVITPKETEGLMWGLAQISDRPRRATKDVTDPLYILLQKYKRRAIMDVCGEYFTSFEAGRHIFLPLTELERDVLRVCVENTSWLESYDRALLSMEMKKEARAALRSLAAKFETLGIEVNFIPSN